MYIKSLKLKNYKCFESKELTFDNLNFLVGTNGSGKSSIIESVIFALFGYTSQSLLSDIPTRNRSKTCTSELLIEFNEHLYRIIRQFPLKLSIFKDNILLSLSTAEANQYIIDTFGDRQSFFHFRLLDTSQKETNFLEEGQTSLKKIIFAETDTYFTNIKVKLTNIKYERELLNKDKVVIYKYFPSENRLKVLTTNLVDISSQLVNIDKELNDFENDLRESKIQLSNNETKIIYLKKQIENVDNIKSSFDLELSNCQRTISTYETRVEQENKKGQELKKQNVTLVTEKKCYACQRPLESVEEMLETQKKKEFEILENIRNCQIKIDSLKDDICLLEDKAKKEKEQKLQEYKEEIFNLENDQIAIKEEIKINTEVKEQLMPQRQALLDKKEKIQTLKMKLEARLKQREFIYTENDVLVAKKALEELDKMSSFYLVETVATLEPIINSVLTKINFSVKFDVDNKGKFNIVLTKDDVQYKYKDLSCGQKLILQIAFKIALLLQQNKTGLLVADEGMSSLDNENLQHILTMFEDLPFQLLIVLHRFNEFPDNANVIRLGE